MIVDRTIEPTYQYQQLSDQTLQRTATHNHQNIPTNYSPNWSRILPKRSVNRIKWEQDKCQRRVQAHWIYQKSQIEYGFGCLNCFQSHWRTIHFHEPLSLVLTYLRSCSSCFCTWTFDHFLQKDVVDNQKNLPWWYL